jgi:hypothetical protein
MEEGLYVVMYRDGLDSDTKLWTPAVVWKLAVRGYTACVLDGVKRGIETRRVWVYKEIIDGGEGYR